MFLQSGDFLFCKLDRPASHGSVTKQARSAYGFCALVSLPADIIAFCIIASILRVGANWPNGAYNFPNDTQDIDIWP
jgi:hypothetical protein